MAVAFAGTAPFGAAILEGMLERGDVALVISQPDRPAGRGRKVNSPPVAVLARERGLPLVQPERTHAPEVLDELRRLDVDTIVVAAFGQMIREPLLSDFVMLNVHGSLLPEYRGAAPIERAIMDGRSETGVCIMQMDVGLDTGPVAYAGTVPIALDDDAGAIFAAVAREGSRLLETALVAAREGTLEFTPQPDEGATYAHKITSSDRLLDFAAPPREVHDRIRALSPHIGSFFEVGDPALRVTAWRSRVVGDLPADDELVATAATLAPGATWHDDTRLLVGCGGGAIEVVELQPAGKRRMPAGDWLRGLRSELGHVRTRADA